MTVIQLLTKLANGDVFTRKGIEQALGRVQWATAACPLAKPVPQSFWAWMFWAWMSATQTSGKPGKIVRYLASLLLEAFQIKTPASSPYCPCSKWHGASDAGAEKFADRVYIGGWLSGDVVPDKASVWWFQYLLTRDKHPWAFKDGDPQRRIAAAELFGSLLLVTLLVQKVRQGVNRSSASVSPSPQTIKAMLLRCLARTLEAGQMHVS